MPLKAYEAVSGPKLMLVEGKTQVKCNRLACCLLAVSTPVRALTCSPDCSLNDKSLMLRFRLSLVRASSAMCALMSDAETWLGENVFVLGLSS